ncbi:MAG: formylglycine-generating enzyme family protein [Brumimicrobium sp.]|nr:formylglycine-generating enzyme family protein [Brumimicrobium sp.]MCO5267685.1 formylglycine-generating enzyme family protein [Brumimicrobium sp.]
MLFRLFSIVLISLFSHFIYGQSKGMALIKGGSFKPLYVTGQDAIKVNDFELDIYPVTNVEFQRFLIENPKWQKKNVLALYADSHYLSQFDESLKLKNGFKPNAPVTNISWFAARAYCECQGKRLATVDEWEYVARADQTSKDASDKEGFTAYILSWYEKPNSYDKVIGSTFKNYWGVYDMHGLVWEWTYDYNSVLISGESRKDLDENANLFCGGAAVNVEDLRNYAAFMRYAFRGSLKSNYSVKNLGFRCAKSVK